MSDKPDNLVLNLLRTIRGELAEHRTLMVGLVEQGQRLDRRFGELQRDVREIKDDIELMLKAEIMGRLGNFETRIEAQIDALAERLESLEKAP